MNLHANAALSWTGGRQLCELVVVEGWTVSAAAAACRVSVRCARKWVRRYRLEGVAGLGDRSRFTAAEIAETLGTALSTVSGILTRIGFRSRAPEPLVSTLTFSIPACFAGSRTLVASAYWLAVAPVRRASLTSLRVPFVTGLGRSFGSLLGSPTTRRLSVAAHAADREEMT